MPRCPFWTALVLVAAGAGMSDAAELQLLPGFARLDGPKARQRFLVEANDGGAFVADRTGDAAFRVADPAVASVSADGTVTPVSDGTTELVATVDGHTARATISVENHDRDTPWSFRNHVLSVLTKAGCNSG